MNEMTSAQKDKLMADLKLVVADAEELLRVTAGAAGEGAAEMRGRVTASLAQAKASLAHAQEVALEKAKAAGRATDEYVHDNPWKSIGVAAGAGLLIGLLIGRR
jgi:ElaB/YqjD/DUF883 family membrane-anchored ribosome-binding protein